MLDTGYWLLDTGFFDLSPGLFPASGIWFAVSPTNFTFFLKVRRDQIIPDLTGFYWSLIIDH
jgi:hypothetical protein